MSASDEVDQEAPPERSDGASAVPSRWVPPIEREGARGIVRTLLEPWIRPAATIGAIGDGPVQPAIAVALAAWIATGAAPVITAALAADTAVERAVRGALRLVPMEVFAVGSIAVLFSALLAVAGARLTLREAVRAAGYGQIYLLATLPVALLVRVFERGLAVLGIAITITAIYGCAAMLGFARRRVSPVAAAACLAPFVAVTVALALVSISLAIHTPFPIDDPPG